MFHKPISLKSLIKSNSGSRLDEKKWLESGKRHAELTRQSESIAEKLKLENIKAFRKDGRAISIVNLITGESQPVISYRNSNLIPLVQSANHRQTLKMLEYYCLSHAYIRMMIITSGERCPPNGIQKRHKLLARKISKWAASPICKKRKIEVIFARDELTFDEMHFVHVHSHVLINPKKMLGSEEWGQFLKESADFFGTKILDSGKLKNPAEAVKYCLKPSEIEDKSPQMIGELFNQLHRQKLCRCMGGLARMQSELSKGKLKIGKRKIKIDGKTAWIPCLVKKAGNGGATYSTESSSTSTDIILGITAPSAISRPVLDPYLIVADYNGDIDSLLKRRGLEEWRKIGLENNETNKPSTVHTSSIIVQAKNNEK